MAKIACQPYKSADNHQRPVLLDPGIYFNSLFWTSPFCLLPICWFSFAVTSTVTLNWKPPETITKNSSDKRMWAPFQYTILISIALSVFLKDPIFAYQTWQNLGAFFLQLSIPLQQLFRQGYVSSNHHHGSVYICDYCSLCTQKPWMSSCGMSLSDIPQFILLVSSRHWQAANRGKFWFVAPV